MRPAKGSKLLRKGRRSIPNQTYLITTATDNREKIFLNPKAAHIVMESLHWQVKQKLITLDAAVVMPDHVHFIARLNDTDLPGLMQRCKNFTSLQINRALNRRGPVWQRGYHDHAIRKEEDINEVVMYVLNNPIRSGLIDDFRDYPFWYCRWEV